MKRKTLIEPRLRRKIPERFTWVDHNLVRKGYNRKCSIGALGFYLFLLTVSDCDGLSYYGEKRIALELNIPDESVVSLRNELVSNNLIAYRDGIYQVLDLQKEQCQEPFTGMCKASDVVAKLLGGMRNG